MAKPAHNDPSPINTSSSNGAPVEAREALDAAVATVGALTGPGLATNDAGIGAAPDEDEDDGPPEPEVGAVDAAVVGFGHEASALPVSAPWTPQIVTGMVAPVPGLPGVPIGVELDSAPSHVPVEPPSSAAATAQTVTGAETGAEPVVVVPM